jgi:hypothetical protein
MLSKLAQTTCPHTHTPPPRTHAPIRAHTRTETNTHTHCFSCIHLLARPQVPVSRPSLASRYRANARPGIAFQYRVPALETHSRTTHATTTLQAHCQRTATHIHVHTHMHNVSRSRTIFHTPRARTHTRIRTDIQTHTRTHTHAVDPCLSPGVLRSKHTWC